MTVGWRGDSYKHRSGSVQTYEEARDRTHALAPESWTHYLAIARAHGLPTGPQILWPGEWEAGGGYAGYLGTVPRARDGRDLVSGLQMRELLGISRKTWRLLTDDLEPDVSVAHKSYYDRARVREHIATRIGRLKKCDAKASIEQALNSL